MDIRAKGLIKLIGGAAGTVLAVVVLFGTSLADRPHGGPFQAIAMGLPGAYGLTGLIELVSGVPFTQLSDKWDQLQGWQRGVLGLFIVGACFGLMMAGVVMFA